MGVEKDDQLEKGEEVEQQLHTAEEFAQNPATNIPEVGKVDMDQTAQGSNREEEVVQPVPAKIAGEQNAEKPTRQMDDVMDVVRQITADIEPNSMAEAPEEAHFESVPVGQAMEKELAEEVEPSPAAEREFGFAADTRMHPTDEEEAVPMGEVTTTPVVPRRQELMVVTDDDEVDETEPARESTRQDIGGRDESPARSMIGHVVGASTRRRRLLRDEEPEEEEDDVFIQPIGEPQIQRQPERETLLVYRKRQPDASTRADDSDRERRECKRKGKVIAEPARKKFKQPSGLL